MADDPAKTPAEQEAEERARSKKPRAAADKVAEVPADTSERTEGEAREPRKSDQRRPAIPKARLVDESESFLGASPWVVAAALHDVDDDAELTPAQAEKRIERYLGDRAPQSEE